MTHPGPPPRTLPAVGSNLFSYNMSLLKRIVFGVTNFLHTHTQNILLSISESRPFRNPLGVTGPGAHRLVSALTDPCPVFKQQQAQVSCSPPPANLWRGAPERPHSPDPCGHRLGRQQAAPSTQTLRKGCAEVRVGVKSEDCLAHSQRPQHPDVAPWRRQTSGCSEAGPLSVLPVLSVPREQ